MTSPERGFCAVVGSEPRHHHHIPGACVEMRSVTGGSAMIIALTLLQRGMRKRNTFPFRMRHGV
jgi:hypothetical protein